jgi:Cof subfamily protein (haloacid dehalogenase superfamily)
VALDLDGTLLDSAHQIPSENAAAIEKLYAEGIAVSVASGRMHASSARYTRQISAGAPTISYNGAMVRSGDAAPLLHRPLAVEVAAEIVEFCRAESIHLNYYADDRVYVEERGAWAELYLSQTGSPMEVIEDLRLKLPTPPTKLLLIRPPDEAKVLAHHFAQLLAGRAYVTRTNPEYVEFMHPCSSKGTALEFLADHLGIPLEETAAVGDALNDIPMLKTAGFGVAMPCSNPSVAASADYTADSFTHAVEAILQRHRTC